MKRSIPHRLFRAICASFWVKHWLCRFRWYRKWHGGRWELWWIPICAAALWLEVDDGRPDDYRQPCSDGPRIAREDWLIIGELRGE